MAAGELLVQRKKLDTGRGPSAVGRQVGTACRARGTAASAGPGI